MPVDMIGPIKVLIERDFKHNGGKRTKKEFCADKMAGGIRNLYISCITDVPAHLDVLKALQEEYDTAKG
jgi:hypothetical protein